MSTILVVDDEDVIQDVLVSLVEKAGWTAKTASSGEEALALIEREPPDLVLLDLMLPMMSGMDVLKQLRQEHPAIVVVIITAFSSIEGAIEALRAGAFDYIPKPFKHDHVMITLEKGLAQVRLTQENRELRQRLRERSSFTNIIGKSKTMRDVFEVIRRAAPSKSNILVLGESGTGKELVAKAIHHHSTRSGGPFVAVNSGSMSHDLFESHLFGHIKGAFTGAIANKKGLFEHAHQGSLFFDEIGNVPLDTQAKLLRVIQEKEFLRVGDIESRKADVRIIAATNADLEARVADGQFRSDLYFRLNVIAVYLPALRQRTEDIPLLADSFLTRLAEENKKTVQRFTPEAMQYLMDYPWPGNVRELENVIERGVVLSTGEAFSVEMLPPAIREPREAFRIAAPSAPSVDFREAGFKDAVANYERLLISQALESAHGVQKRAAELLQVGPTTLHEMMKRLGLLKKKGQ